MKSKGKILKGLGIGLLFGSLIFFLQISGLKREAAEIAITNEARAQVRLDHANFNQTMGIVCLVGGVAFLALGFWKSSK